MSGSRTSHRRSWPAASLTPPPTKPWLTSNAPWVTSSGPRTPISRSDPTNRSRDEPRTPPRLDPAFLSHRSAPARPGRKRFQGGLVFAAYGTVTIIASVFNGIAAVTYLIGHRYPK